MKEKDKKRNLKLTVLIILIIIALLILVTVIYPNVYKDISRTAYSTVHIGPNMPMELLYCSYQNESENDSYWENREVIHLTDEDFAEYPSLNELFSNIDTGINKNDAVEKRIIISKRFGTSTPIISQIITDEIQNKYGPPKILYWNEDYFVISMPME